MAHTCKSQCFENLRQEDPYSPGVSGCSELWLYHCIPSWVTEHDPKKTYIFYLFICFLRQSVTLVHQAGVQWCNLGSLNLRLLSSSHSPVSASWGAGITSACHHAQLIFAFLVETGFHHVVGQAGLKLLTSRDPPASASQSAGITGVSHLT